MTAKKIPVLKEKIAVQCKIKDMEKKRKENELSYMKNRMLLRKRKKI